RFAIYSSSIILKLNEVASKGNAMALEEVNKIENKPFHPDLTIFSFRRQKENAPDEKSKLVFVLNFPD
ncbi:hypothetical protein ACFQHQ_17755, partial [Zunongwangia atlantica 22II14-10F7]